MRVLADEIYGRIVYEGRARLDRLAAGHGRADDRARRLLQDVRDDRLADGLRDRAAGAGRAYSQLIINTIIGRRRVRAGRGGRGARRSAGRGRRDGRRVPRPARPGRRWPQHDPRHPMPRCRRARSTSSRTIAGTGMTGAELADRLLYEAGVCVLAGHRIRQGGRRPHPDQLRELPGQPAPRRSGGSETFVASARAWRPA